MFMTMAVLMLVLVFMLRCMLVPIAMVVVMLTMLVVMIVAVVVIAVGSTDELQGLLQNAVSDFHAADCLIEQGCQILVSILSRLFGPFPKIFSVMVIVFNPVGQQYPQLVDGGFVFHFFESSCFVLLLPISFEGLLILAVFSVSFCWSVCCGTAPSRLLAWPLKKKATQSLVPFWGRTKAFVASLRMRVKVLSSWRIQLYHYCPVDYFSNL
jgi:hypothetical protein